MPNKAMELKKFKKNEPLISIDEWSNIYDKIKEHFNSRKALTFVIMHHGICLGSFNEEGNFIMPASLPLQPEYLRSVRVFDQDSECYVWKSSMDDKNLFRLRIRQDEEDKTGESEVIEARQLLWGTRLDDCPEDKDWKILKEDRGIELRINNSLIPSDTKINKEDRLWLITRNYIGYTPVGQAGYEDCRFVGIESGKGVAR